MERGEEEEGGELGALYQIGKRREEGGGDIFPHLLFGRGIRGLFSLSTTVHSFVFCTGLGVLWRCGAEKERKKESVQFKIDDQKYTFGGGQGARRPLFNGGQKKIALQAPNKKVRKA